MSYISDYLSGNTDKAEFDMYGNMENRKERWEEEHKYDQDAFGETNGYRPRSERHKKSIDGQMNLIWESEDK